jgi:hypothetical protein
MAVFCGVPLDILVLPQSFLPVTWPSMKMGHRNNVKSLRFNLVDQSVWKLVEQATARVLGQCRPCIWILNDASNGLIDIFSKLKIKPRLALFIEVYGPVEFFLGIRVKIESHR